MIIIFLLACTEKYRIMRPTRKYNKSEVLYNDKKRLYTLERLFE